VLPQFMFPRGIRHNGGLAEVPICEVPIQDIAACPNRSGLTQFFRKVLVISISPAVGYGSEISVPLHRVADYEIEREIIKVGNIITGYPRDYEQL
jgi:hypothetical protein